MKMKRIETIDLMRGLVMIIMALDHTRDFMHSTSLVQNPLDLSGTTPLLFFTRWITHLCAPVFVFLSGTSAYLSIKRQNNPAQSRNFLLIRGLWLVFLEFTVINFALWFDLRFRILLFQVIAAIGFGFIFLALLMKFRIWVPGIIALLIIFGHNLLTTIPFEDGSFGKTVLSPLVNFSSYQVTPEFVFVIAYPFLPWFGIMLAGFACGQIFETGNQNRKRQLLQAGLALLALFAILRFINVYGDPSPWSVQSNFINTFLSFINTSKYPPSLLFTLMTLGIMFLLLALGENMKNRFTGVISVYGRVPFFYYLIHLYVIHFLTIIIMFLQGFSWSDLSFEPFRFGRPVAPSGIELWLVYLVWIGVVAGLYPLCKWYGKYKSANKYEKGWLRYL